MQENKCTCCKENEEHTCPFQVEFGDDETLCNCCEYCEGNCAMDI